MSGKINVNRIDAFDAVTDESAKPGIEKIISSKQVNQVVDSIGDSEVDSAGSCEVIPEASILDIEALDIDSKGVKDYADVDDQKLLAAASATLSKRLDNHTVVADKDLTFYELICRQVLKDDPHALAPEKINKIKLDILPIKEDASIDFEAISRASEAHIEFEESKARGDLRRIFQEQQKLLHISEQLDANANREIRLQKAKNTPVIQKHVMYKVADVIVFEEDVKVGSVLVLPDVNKIAADKNFSWVPKAFISWDYNDAAIQTDMTINAVLKPFYTVTVFLNGSILDKDEHVVEGTKVTNVLSQIISSHGMADSFFDNYNVTADVKLVDRDCSIKIVSKEAGKIRVVFMVDIQELPFDISELSDDELYNATVIKEVWVEPHESVDAPTDSEIAAVGLKVPFSNYYHWSDSLDDITAERAIYALPASVADKFTDVFSRAYNTIAEANSIQAAGSLIASTAQTAGHTLKNSVISAVGTLGQKRMLKLFKSGGLIKSDNFEFYSYNGSLMLAKYTSAGSVLEIPAFVNGMPVEYLGPEFLVGGLGIFNNYKRRGITNAVKTGSFTSFSHLKEISKGLQSIIFPNTLRQIPDDCFYGCNMLYTIVIPESVDQISSKAFRGCHIEQLIFNGPCPQGLEYCNIHSKIYVKRQYYKTFSKVKSSIVRI